MNDIRVSLSVLVVCVVWAFQGTAQSRNGESQNQRDGDLGDRLGTEIERLVDRITRQFSLSDNTAPDDEDTLVQKRRVLGDLESEKNTHSFTGTTVIPSADTVDGNIVVKGGDLTVYGRIGGDVLVVGGTLYVKDGATIAGNARVINGTIVREPGGTIEGYEDKTSASTAGYREKGRTFVRGGKTFDVPWLSESSNLDNFVFRYNKIEGIFVGMGSEKKYYWDGERHYTAYGSIGWGFKSHTWRYNIGLDRQFAFSGVTSQSILEFGAEYYSLTDSKDQWLIGVHENSAAAFFFHEDFRDYFARDGFTVHAGHYSRLEDLNAEVSVAYLADKYDALSNNAEWALFGGEKLFRPNAFITPGNMRSVLVTAGVSTITKSYQGPEGWSFYGTAEFAQKAWGSNFEFNHYVVDIRRLQPLGRYDNVNVRIRAGTTEGLNAAAVPQKAFDLGGLGTLNAFPFKAESGNRLLLVNAEYIVNGNMLDDLDFWPTWVFRHVNFLLFSDAGLVRNAPTGSSALQGFDGLTWSEFRHDFGVGFSNHSGSFRAGISWRTDVKEPARFVLRFARPF